MIASRRLDGLAGDLNGNEDSLPLEPFCGQSVLLVGPLAFRHDSPGSCLKRNRSKCKFIEGKNATPFRRMTKGSDGVGQHRQDTTFGIVHRQ
jgi:hypothetical protein